MRSNRSKHASRLAKTRQVTTEVPAPTNWGFRFVVEPLHGIPYRVVRELELVCILGRRSRQTVRARGPTSVSGEDQQASATA